MKRYFIDKAHLATLLAPRGLRIGGWNEIRPVNPADSNVISFSAPSDAGMLLEVASSIADWIGCGDWVLFQFDNSTCPLESEIGVLEVICGLDESWDVAVHRSLLIEDIDGFSKQRLFTQVSVIINFCLVFEWHVYLTSSAAMPGQLIGLQDGVVYAYGTKQKTGSLKVKNERESSDQSP